MTLSPWLIYFSDQADDLDAFFAITAFLLMAFGLVLFHFNWKNYRHKKETNWRPFKYICIYFLSTLAISIFIPTTATVYKMMIIPPVVNSNVVQKLPDELQQYINKVLSTKDVK